MAAAGRFRLALILLTVAFAAPARAEDINDTIERITNFQQDITVARDGTMSVRETITVNAHGDFIGNMASTVTSRRFIAARGRCMCASTCSAPRWTESRRRSTRPISTTARGCAWAIPTRQLSHGLHTFDIRYVTDRQIGFFDKRDELYWNVTGLGWDFEIRQAGVVIHLPDNAKIESWNFFTGPKGKRDKNAVARVLSPNTIAFDTTAILDPNSGLTVVVDFAKGASAAAGGVGLLGARQ